MSTASQFFGSAVKQVFRGLGTGSADNFGQFSVALSPAVNPSKCLVTLDVSTVGPTEDFYYDYDIIYVYAFSASSLTIRGARMRRVSDTNHAGRRFAYQIVEFY